MPRFREYRKIIRDVVIYFTELIGNHFLMPTVHHTLIPKWIIVLNKQPRV